MQLRKHSEDKAKQAKLSPDALPTPSPDDACTISPIESPTISEKKEKNLQQCQLQLRVSSCASTAKMTNQQDKASLSGSFMKNFITLNTIIFADMVRRENDEYEM